MSDTLSVQVQGAGAEPERLFVLSRSAGGAAAGDVEVREFRFADGDAAGPLEYTARAADVLAALERAHRERRRLSEDIYRIRLWLGS